MAVEYTKGSILTYNIDDRRAIDVARDIPTYMPDDSPFSVILMRARKKVTNSAEFNWYDSDPAGWKTQVNGAVADVAETAITVDDSSVFSPKDVIKIPSTGEVVFVTEITSDTAIKVVRGYGTTAAAAIADNAWLLRMGNAMEENSSAPESKSKQPKKFTNYTQIFRTPFDQSMTSDAEDLKTAESERARLRREKSLEHRLDIERATLFGEKKEDTTNKRRMTGGLVSFITSNAYDAGGTLTEAEFESYCEMLFQYGPKKKLFVCSPKVGSIINQFAAGKIETTSGETTYGIQLKEYQSFHGRLYIVTSQCFEQDYASMGIGITMDNVYYRPLKGRDTKLKTNIQNNDLDGWQDEYITEAGLMVRLEKTHAILKNVTA